MRGWRRRGAWIASVWLVCQISALAASPLVLACHAGAAMTADADDDDACCKGLAPGQMCPMHKHRAHGHHQTPEQASTSPATSPATKDASRDPACRLRSTCDPISFAIESLLPGSGMLPRAATIGDDLTVRSTGLHPVEHALTRTTSPDLPPPRL